MKSISVNDSPGSIKLHRLYSSRSESASIQVLVTVKCRRFFIHQNVLNSTVLYLPERFDRGFLWSDFCVCGFSFSLLS